MATTPEIVGQIGAFESSFLHVAPEATPADQSGKRGGAGPGGRRFGGLNRELLARLISKCHKAADLRTQQQRTAVLNACCAELPPADEPAGDGEVPVAATALRRLYAVIDDATRPGHQFRAGKLLESVHAAARNTAA